MIFFWFKILFYDVFLIAVKQLRLLYVISMLNFLKEIFFKGGKRIKIKKKENRENILYKKQ